MTIEQILTVLTAGDFDQFIGQAETETFECKRQPYQLGYDRDECELAKDVSSLANATGGFIIIGLHTERDDATFTDTVRRVGLLDRALIDPQRYENIINNWIVPGPRFAVQFYPTNADPNRGLFAIHVPEQPQSERPFLIARVVSDTDRRLEIVCGFAERKAASSQPTSVRDLHQFFRQGRQFSQAIAARFDALEARLTATRPAPPVERDLDAIIERALDAVDMQTRRALTLTAYPTELTELRTIFQPQQPSIYWRLEHPPRPRRDGWDMATLDEARIIDGTFLRVQNGNRMLLELYRGGLFLFAGQAEAHFYCWGRRPDEPKINSLALIEATLNFAEFYGLVVADMEPEPAEFQVEIDFRNLLKDGIPTFMMPDSIRDFNQQFGTGQHFNAPGAQARRSVLLQRELMLDGPAAAYRIVREIYVWFGMNEQQIPYVRSEDGRTFTDRTLFPTT
jgi:hypothetical protein